jgi:transcriptional regulator with XRE-family HTH domain
VEVAVPRPSPIKAHAALAGLTIGELADALGVSRNTFYDVARGTRRAWPKLRRDLAEYLGVPEVHLFPNDRRVAS